MVQSPWTVEKTNMLGCQSLRRRQRAPDLLDAEASRLRDGVIAVTVGCHAADRRGALVNGQQVEVQPRARARTGSCSRSVLDLLPRSGAPGAPSPCRLLHPLRSSDALSRAEFAPSPASRTRCTSCTESEG